MTIEIKQLRIRSSLVAQGRTAENDVKGDGAYFINDSERAEILNECRKMILDLIRDKSER